MAGLLVRFVPSHPPSLLRDDAGRGLDDVAAMLAEAAASGDDGRRRDCHRQVGDFALFWTGVYPESVPRLRAAMAADALIDYQVQGKRSYYLASTYDGDESAILRRLSVEFDLCAFGLSRVRWEWERREGTERSTVLIVA